MRRAGAEQPLSGMDDPPSTELLLLACELAVQVESRPERRDGSDAAVYPSSGQTLARRIRAGGLASVACEAAIAQSEPVPAPYCWTVSLRAGAARRTNYKLWLHESPGELKQLWLARKEALALREKLPHDQRKRKPWGPL
jgi:hypothetical protein